MIAYMTAKDAAARVSEPDDVHSTHDDKERQELLEEYKGWLRQAALKKKDVVFFYR